MNIELLPNRIADKIDDTGDCWVWAAARHHPSGYGKVWWNQKTRYAHRVVWQILVGPIDTDGLDHLCRERACVNPDHLEPVSNRENVLRGVGVTAVNAKKTHCPQGHSYDEANTATYRNMRYCRTCHRERTRRRRARTL